MPSTAPGPRPSQAPSSAAETHISWVWFVGDRAYKLKKPVDMGFLDFSTVEARRRACEREVDLNSRLAADVYLGVLDLVDPDGDVIDHLVAMRRMPEQSRLSTLVTEGDVHDSNCVRDVARLVAEFHERADRSAEIDQAGSAEAVLANWEDSFVTLDGLVDGPVDSDADAQIRQLVRRFIAGRGPLLAERVAAGRTCDGHGDLQADDIFCLPDGPRILDCIEFADSLRHGDVLSDVAFLAMDLERLGAPDLGREFLGWYREFAADPAPASLVEHYVAYRAHVRCKINCLRAAQETGAEQEKAAAEARRLHAMALRYLGRARVRLVLVGGAPGTGKSTLGEGLASTMGWTLLRSDEIRKELAGLDPAQPAAAGWKEGLYTTEMTDRTYQTMLDWAGTALARGETVVLDASWADPRWRDAAASVADGVVADLESLRCVAPLDVARVRVAERLLAESDVSDATDDVVRRMAAEFAPWDQAVEIATSDGVDLSLRSGLEAVGVPDYLPPDVVA